MESDILASKREMAMNRILRCLYALALFALLVGARSAKGDETMVCRTEKSMYAPGETAVVCLENLPAEATALRARLYSLERCVLDWQLPASKRFPLSLPDADGRGYALEVEALDEQQNVLTSAFTAVDVSSSWTKFPRYGYVWDFTPSADAESKADEMARYHLNGVQFYDWQYRHHRPLADDLSGWRDWSGRWISGDTVRAYLRAAHDRGMACMAYNMIYAANETYLTDGSGVQADWRLVRANGADFTCDMDAKLGPVGVLQYFNLLNPDWQNYIFAQENRVFEAFDFDGWHGDTIGENGPMRTADGGPLGYDADGKPIYLVKDGYTAFLNAAKAAIGDKYLAFNPVGAQGIENVNVSAVDVLYTEFWPWDRNANGRLYDDYYTLHRAILGACEQSGGKSLIVAAYVNYRNPKAAFNPAAVRMLDCVVFASGGSRIELGNGGNMLSDEYFPADGKKRMDDGLRSAVGRLYDFLVAYENLLRDGQRPVSRTVRLENLPVSTDGRSDTVWCFAKADSSTEIYHFLNLTGTDDGWRDEEQTKKPPIAHENVKTRLYTDYPIREVWLASPDGESPLPLHLEFQTGRDANGAYAEFTQPALEYWNLIFLR